MTLIHTARALFESLPVPVRAVAAVPARMLPERVRYGATFAQTRRLLAEQEFRTAEERGVLVKERLAALSAAALRSPWWRQTLEAHGLGSGIANLADLGRLPLLDKATVRAHGGEMLDPAFPEALRKQVSTSGSTGEPMSFWVDRDASVIDWAYTTDAWHRAGFQLDEKRVVLRGPRPNGDGSLFAYEPLRRELSISSLDLTPATIGAIAARINRFGARFIHGYPSAVDALMRLWPATVPRPQLTALLLVSETVDPDMRVELERYFGCRVFSHYGMSEKVAFAAECEQGSCLHVDETFGVLELVNPATGEPVTAPGTMGEIVSTGLVSRCMPLLRYRTGDLAEWAEGECACGRHTRRLARVAGRSAADVLVGADGARFMPALGALDAVFGDVQRFRLVQSRPGEAELLLLPRGAWTAEQTAAAQGAISQRLHGRVAITARVVDDLPLSAAGKHRRVDQRIPGGDVR